VAFRGRQPEHVLGVVREELPILRDGR